MLAFLQGKAEKCFKVPALGNIELAGPYILSGSLLTLDKKGRNATLGALKSVKRYFQP